LPVEGRAGPSLNTRIPGLSYEPGNELGRGLGALGGARTPTRETDTVQGTGHGTHVRNKKASMPIQPTQGCPKAYRTWRDRRKQKEAYQAGSHTYRGLIPLRPVTEHGHYSMLYIYNAGPIGPGLW
jgi:hypothetical protein